MKKVSKYFIMLPNLMKILNILKEKLLSVIFCSKDPDKLKISILITPGICFSAFFILQYKVAGMHCVYLDKSSNQC